MARDTRGVTPVHIAAGIAPSCAETMGLLVDAGADVDARKDDGCTPLHSAAGRLRADAIDLLLRHGADETLVNDKGNTPLDVVGRRVSGNDVSGDAVDSVRKLLRGAPAERAWRRRKCIVLCRARLTSSTVGPSHQAAARQTRRRF